MADLADRTRKLGEYAYSLNRAAPFIPQAMMQEVREVSGNPDISILHDVVIIPKYQWDGLYKLIREVVQ